MTFLGADVVVANASFLSRLLFTSAAGFGVFLRAIAWLDSLCGTSRFLGASWLCGRFSCFFGSIFLAVRGTSSPPRRSTPRGRAASVHRSSSTGLHAYVTQTKGAATTARTYVQYHSRPQFKGETGAISLWLREAVIGSPEQHK